MRLSLSPYAVIELCCFRHCRILQTVKRYENARLDRNILEIVSEDERKLRGELFAEGDDNGIDFQLPRRWRGEIPANRRRRHCGCRTGGRVTGQTPGTEYLNKSVRLLVKPRQYNSKSGLTDARYYHGGILPRECMLNFHRIEKE